MIWCATITYLNYLVRTIPFGMHKLITWLVPDDLVRSNSLFKLFGELQII